MVTLHFACELLWQSRGKVASQRVIGFHCDKWQRLVVGRENKNKRIGWEIMLELSEPVCHCSFLLFVRSQHPHVVLQLFSSLFYSQH